jgi:hypothetical protein
MKLKRIITSMVMLILTLSLTLANTNITYAEEVSTKVKLNTIFITVPYSPSSINVIHTRTSKAVEATIIDKSTGEVLDVLGEVIEQANKSLLQPSSPMTVSYGSTYQSLVYRDKVVGPAKARLYTRLEIYTYGSFRQINKILDTYWSEASSGNWVLERESSYGYMDSIPDITAHIGGSSNIVITTTSNVSGGFSIEALESIGFQLSAGTGSTYYARKPIEFTYAYSVY